jgi:hypothetical protein
MVIWYIFFLFGMLYQENSGNPAKMSIFNSSPSEGGDSQSNHLLLKNSEAAAALAPLIT